MKERLTEHLRSVDSLIKDWVGELSLPMPFTFGETSWPCRVPYTPRSESDEDKNHILRRHLRGRALWRNHADWMRKVRMLEEQGGVICRQATEMRPQCSAAYREAALWAAYRLAIGEKFKKKYAVEQGKGITFYGVTIDDTTVTTEKDRVADDHWKMLTSLAKLKEMATFIEMLERARVFQMRIRDLVVKVLSSSDIFYPCKFCKRLMEA
jgi:hypothetical protein